MIVDKRCFGIFVCDCSSDEECFDNNECTVDFCDTEHSGRCLNVAHAVPVSHPCDDLTDCTANDVCQVDGTCRGTLTEAGDSICPAKCDAEHGRCCGDKCECIVSGFAGESCDVKIDALGTFFDWCSGEYAARNDCFVGVPTTRLRSNVSFSTVRENGMVIGVAAENGLLKTTNKGVGIEGAQVFGNNK